MLNPLLFSCRGLGGGDGDGGDDDDGDGGGRGAESGPHPPVAISAAEADSRAKSDSSDDDDDDSSSSGANADRKARWSTIAGQAKHHTYAKPLAEHGLYRRGARITKKVSATEHRNKANQQNETV